MTTIIVPGKEAPVENPKLQFILEGFSQVSGIRIFQFVGVAADRSRTPYTVSADLAMSRRHSIRLQELPLLCRAVLDRCYEGVADHAFTYTEEEMSLHAGRVSAILEAAKKRKPPRPPAPDQSTSPWRVPPQ